MFLFHSGGAPSRRRNSRTREITRLISDFLFYVVRLLLRSNGDDDERHNSGKKKLIRKILVCFGLVSNILLQQRTHFREKGKDKCWLKTVSCRTDEFRNALVYETKNVALRQINKIAIVNQLLLRSALYESNDKIHTA